MKRLALLIFTVFFLGSVAYAQPERIGAGLSFATKKRFNGGDTGNPGLNVRTWIAIDKTMRFHVVPSVTLYSPLVIDHTTHFTTTYMFHGDIDFQYQLYHEKTLKLAAFAGANYTHIISKNELVISIPEIPADSAVYGFGPNIGAAMEMRMSPYIDFILSGKYTFGGIGAGDTSIGQKKIIAPLSAPIIQIHAVYYFHSRGRGYIKR